MLILYSANKPSMLTSTSDPASGKLIGSCPEFSKEDTDNAIKIAAEAFPSFRKTTGRERARWLRKWHQLMMDNIDDLATLITWENGKPIADAKGEVTYAAAFYEWFSEEAPRNYGDTIPASIPGNRVFTIKEPVGVCGLITPYVHIKTIMYHRWLFLTKTFPDGTSPLP